MKLIGENSLPDFENILAIIEELLGEGIKEKDDNDLVFLLMAYERGFKDSYDN